TTMSSATTVPSMDECLARLSSAAAFVLDCITHHLLHRRVHGKLLGNGALAHHQDAIAHCLYLLQLGGDENDTPALLGQTAHQGIDLTFGAHVNAPGGLVHQNDGAVGGQP